MASPESEARREPPVASLLRLPIHAEWHGSEGSPILMIHGFSANGYTWQQWLPGLVDHHRVLVVDLKGAGSSPKPVDADFGPQEQAFLLHRLILQNNLKNLTLVGHSLGGGIALLTALHLLEEEPTRLSRLVLVASAAYRQPVPRFIALAARPRLGPLALKIIPASTIIRAGLRRAYHRPEKITSSQVEAYAEPLRSSDGRRALSRMARQIIPPDLDRLTDRYPEIPVPTLLLWGREDTIVPLAIGKRLAQDLPRSRLAVLPDCGHMPQEELPRESLALFLEFMEAGE